MPLAGPLGGRARNARTVLGLAAKGVRSATVRLRRSVHAADGRYGFASVLVVTAQRTGTVGYVGDGSQRWPAVHRLDGARLSRLALEQAEPGPVEHAVGDEGDTMLSLAKTIARRQDLPVSSVPADHYGFLGSIFAVDQPASSARTQERFGWQPRHPSLIDDLTTGVYPAWRVRGKGPRHPVQARGILGVWTVPLSPRPRTSRTAQRRSSRHEVRSSRCSSLGRHRISCTSSPRTCSARSSR